jgi:hypothetical protein
MLNFSGQSAHIRALKGMVEVGKVHIFVYLALKRCQLKCVHTLLVERLHNPTYLFLNIVKFNLHTFFCYLLDVCINFSLASSN